uniref:Uncharacterized protein n=1 Tax=Oryza sativa subsp. japonica TaxID=39947 RepID=H2KWU3_ORYSJ|nr:hypothetical protein LOC_Os12g34419 [Oryza sativa Japonica Group]
MPRTPTGGRSRLGSGLAGPARLGRERDGPEEKGEDFGPTRRKTFSEGISPLWVSLFVAQSEFYPFYRKTRKNKERN